LRGVSDQESRYEAAKMLLLLVARIGVEPRRTPLHQIGMQRDLFGYNQFEQPADCRERVAGSDDDEDVVAFTSVQARLGGLDERPR
jgi:hypothetical protein